MRTEGEMSDGSSLSSGSGSDADSLLLRDPARMTCELLVDLHEAHPLLDLFEPLVGWIDPDLRLFHVSDREDVVSQTANDFASAPKTNFQRNSIRNESSRVCLSQDSSLGLHRVEGMRGSDLINERRTEFPDAYSGSRLLHQHSELPALAVMLFFYEGEMAACGRVRRARRHFERPPWRFHHSDSTQRRNINIDPHALDFFFIADDLPLFAVRQVHYGKEHIRIVVHTNVDTWADMVQFYILVIGLEPELVNDGFCLFTVHSQINFDLQFALKRVDTPCSRPVPMQNARLEFKVSDIGRMVPLFPNVCQPISDSRWLTTDHDGNEVVLDVAGHCVNSSRNNASGLTSSVNYHDSSESCTSMSSSDISFEGHDFGTGGCDVFVSDRALPGEISTLDSFKRRKHHLIIDEKREGRRSQKHVTFDFGKDPISPSLAPTSGPYSALCSASDTLFNLKFDTCPTAPVTRNNRREEQIGFYV